MGLLSKLFGGRSKIVRVVVFATDIGAAKAVREAGGMVHRIPPKTMFQTADAQLGLNGALESFVSGRSPDVEDAPEMTDSEWADFLNGRFRGQKWSRWFGKTPNTIYSVVVVRS